MMIDCHYCGDEVISGVVVNGDVICSACDRDLSSPPLDTPSLQDSNPEGWGYITNTNPWTGEKGY